MDADALRQWLTVLDDLSYYDLLRVPHHAAYDEIKAAFTTFCRTFHPDAHAARGTSERGAICFIFKRGTEAYRVLSDPTLRASYDAGLVRGQLRASVSPLPARRESMASIAPV